MIFYHIGLLLLGVASCVADVGVHSASGVSSLPVYGGGHQRARDSRLIQIAVIPANDSPNPSSASPRSQIRGRSITNLNGFVDQQRPGIDRAGVTRNYPNEPLNLDDKDLILFPDQFEQLQQLGVAKDSYGNPVTPFPFSNDELKLRAGAYKVDKTGFIIPSYASGITDVHDPHLPRLKKPDSNVLPPFNSGNIYYPGVKPPVPTETDQSSNELPKPPQLPNIPDFGGSNIQTTVIEVPSDALLPPLETDEYESQYNQPVDINASVPQKDILPPLQQQQPSVQQEQPSFQQQQPSFQQQQPSVEQQPLFQQQPSFQPVTQPPKQPAVQFTVSNNQPVIVPFAPTPTPTQPVPVPQSNPTLAATQSTGNKYSGGFGFANGGKPSTVFFNTIDDNKYTGGFVSASNTATPQVAQLTTSLQAPHLTTSTGNKYTGGFIATPTAPAPVPIPSKPQVETNDRYAGGFVPTVSAPSTFTTVNTNKGNKYTGGFGYANSNTQAQQVAAPSQQVQQQQFPTPVVSSQSTGQKYTGGFGGPPGLLVPFDHINTYSRTNTEQ